MTAIEELFGKLSDEGKELVMLMREASNYHYEQLIDYYKRLLEKFELDSLTGLPGSNKYIEYKSELEARPTATIGVVVFDVNDLKYYNDNKGHQAGDRLLQKAAESFHVVADGGVRIFRTGGDEFVAIITDCGESEMFGVIAKWKEALSELNTANDDITCTIAYGSAFGSGDYSLSDVFKLADERMYAEKRRMKESGVKVGDVR